MPRLRAEAAEREAVGRPKKGCKVSTPSEPGKSRDKVAAAVGLSAPSACESQRAMVGARLKPLFEAEARERMAEGGRGGKIATPSKSRDQAASAVNVSPRSVESAAKELRCWLAAGSGWPAAGASAPRGWRMMNPWTQGTSQGCTGTGGCTAVAPALLLKPALS
jgi:hypothetical protein